MGYSGASSLPDDGSVVGHLIANRYLIEEPCERSPTSAIYRARHLSLGRSVLLRVLTGGGEIRREHCREALAAAERAAALPTPHVARTLDVGVLAERWPFVVAEYSRGKTLAAVLAQQGSLGLGRLLTMARQLAGALALAHSARLRHGKLMLSGVWVESPSGRPEWIRMMDFGLCELPAGESASTPESGVFRYSYPRPELASAFSDEVVRWDLQSFGALLCDLALNSPRRPASDVAAAFEAQLGARGGRELARRLARVAERCLRPAAEVAYPAMDAVCRDLDGLAESLPASERGVVSPCRPVTSVHAPARRAGVAMGGPKVIVRGG